MKRSMVVVLFWTLVLASAQAVWSAQAEAPKGPATYVGNEACKGCHAPQFEKFAGTVMGKIFLHNPRNESEKRACENCHGPGSNHVAAGGGKGVGIMITFRKDSGESLEVQNQACLACHRSGVQTYWEASSHAGRGVGCVDCHKVMERTTDKFQLAKVDDKTPFFNKRAQTEVCGQCHLQRKAHRMRSSHMPLREGKMSCSDCHNPHGSPNPAMLYQTSINENCYSCHAERRGPYLWEHVPVLENCSNCHEPHGSVNDRLLRVTDPRLCTQCHIHSRHPSSPRGIELRFAFNRSCTNCHSQIHGSNHPSGRRFMR